MDAASALDQPGSAGTLAVRLSVAVALAVAGLTLVFVLFGSHPWPALPQFTTFHASFVLIVDGVTSYLLFGQYATWRRNSYAILAGAYLLNALLMVPFVLTYPGALKANGGVFGGEQSSIWVWHVWHLGFASLVVLALLADGSARTGPASTWSTRRVVGAIVGAVVAIVAVVTFAVTVLHDELVPLLSATPPTLRPAFYLFGSAILLVTCLALVLAWRRGLGQRSMLHLWLAVALTAGLGELVGNLASSSRYTLGWYGGRIESMIAGSVLLLLFIRQIGALQQRLAVALRGQALANATLEAALTEKEALLVDLRLSEAEVRQLAFHDALTALPNRRLLLDRMDQAILQARRHRHSMAVLYLDLDSFKEVNDSLGHETGDALLRAVAARLQGILRSGETVSRLGGDEFVVVLSEIARPSDAAAVAEKIAQALRAPFDVGGAWLNVTASVGVAVFAADALEDSFERLRRADEAMYSAKARRRNGYGIGGEAVAQPVPQ